MKITREALSAVRRAASKVTGRYAVSGVLITADKIEATDGHLLLQHAVPDDQRGGFDASKIVSIDSINDALKSKIVKRDGLIVAVGTEKNAQPRYSAIGGPTPMVVADGEFPDSRGIIPGDELIGFRVTFAGALLKALASAAADVDDTYEAVTFEFQRQTARACTCSAGDISAKRTCHCNDDNMGGLSTRNGVRVTMATDIPDKKIVGVIMPMSL